MHDVAKTAKQMTEKPEADWFGRIVMIVITVGALFFLLAVPIGVIKFLQVRKMMSNPMQMPATTVTSAPVKEEDWAPVLSAVGSVSAVQGAVVSAELGGVVAEIGFPNGGEAKKGDVLLKLDSSSEDAQLHTA